MLVMKYEYMWPFAAWHLYLPVTLKKKKKATETVFKKGNRNIPSMILKSKCYYFVFKSSLANSTVPNKKEGEKNS